MNTILHVVAPQTTRTVNGVDATAGGNHLQRSAPPRSATAFRAIPQPSDMKFVPLAAPPSAALLSSATLAMTGHFEQPIILFDFQQRVLYENRAAETMAADRLGLQRVDGCFSCCSAPDQEAFDAMISRLDWASPDDSVPQAMRMHRPPTASHGVLLSVRLVSAAASDGSRVPIGVLLVHARDRKNEQVLHALLRQAFTLTRAEATVAILIANGTTPAEIAAQRRVSVETVRAQLRVLFSKTGVNRQAELVRVVQQLGAFT